MKKILLGSASIFLLFAYNSHVERKEEIAESMNSAVVISSDRKYEGFFPETKAIEKFDTLVANKQIKITITRTDLDSYVVNEYEEEGKKKFDKYRDAEISLVVKQKSKIILDTVFRKRQFLKYADKGFMDSSIFHNYWFKKLDDNKIEFLGVISKPETDYTLDFYHYFDLKTKKLKFVKHTEVQE